MIDTAAVAFDTAEGKDKKDGQGQGGDVKGKGKAREVGLVDEQPTGGGDKMDVDGVEAGAAAATTVDEEPTPGASTTTTRKTSGPTKPALKRKASDRGDRERAGTTTATARSTPGPGNAAGTTGMLSARSREERMRVVPRGELIRHLYKGLMWDEVEKHAQYGWTEVSRPLRTGV